MKREFELYAADALAPARVAAQHRGAYVVYAAAGERPAEVAGRLRHAAVSAADLPAVGDWVAISDGPNADAATIHAVLERDTVFLRKAAGDESVEQVRGQRRRRVPRERVRRRPQRPPDRALPRRRLGERRAARDRAQQERPRRGPRRGGRRGRRGRVRRADPRRQLPEGAGVEELERYFSGNRTAALLGSSGKSTLLNRLLGWDRQETQGLRDDGRGRHTTTRRELVPLGNGGLVLDTPGMREFALWDAEAASTRRSPTWPSWRPSAASRIAPT